jgi:hypothetical protein
MVSAVLGSTTNCEHYSKFPDGSLTPLTYVFRKEHILILPVLQYEVSVTVIGHLSTERSDRSTGH